jgi:uncharacterized protein (DUF1697 family)
MRYVALLQAVNVGGTGKLPMTELKAMCRAAGFADVQTYVASGNAVFTSASEPPAVKLALETRLRTFLGKPVGVVLRTAAQMQAVLEANPFRQHPGNHTVAIFLDAAPARDALQHAKGLAGEEMRLGEREIYVFYGDGMGTSKLRIPGATGGTARNMNTVAALARMAANT